VRVAPLHIRFDRLAELRRILGDDVEVTETTLTEPDAVEGIADAAIVNGRCRRGLRYHSLATLHAALTVR